MTTMASSQRHRNDARRREPGQLLQMAERAVIDSDETYAERRGRWESSCGWHSRKLHQERTSLTAPLNGVIKKINARFKAYTDRTRQGEKHH